MVAAVLFMRLTPSRGELQFITARIKRLMDNCDLEPMDDDPNVLCYV